VARTGRALQLFFSAAARYAAQVESLAPAELDSAEARLAHAIAQSGPGGAPQAEAELYRLLAPRVRRYGLRHLRDAHAAADLMQHVLAFTIEQLRSGAVREPARVLSFVLGTCRMTVTDQRRTENRRSELLERYAAALPAAEIHVAPRLDHQRVADCLERLPERERSVLVLTFYDEQPSDAVGAQLGLSAGNVRVIRHRGLDKLRRCVDAGRARA
jgi:RNA polymerase sigma-70 factor (ECF subfamily)